MKKIGLLLLVVLPVSLLAFSQTTTASDSATTAVAALPPAQVVTLGNSVVPLTGQWKFSPGDSPWVNGLPVWAQPGYDDSKWAAMDMTPKSGSVNVQLGTEGYIPGWTKRGYPGLSGYAWYRLRVKVADPGQRLWLKMPNDFDDAFQVYANGHFAGQFGDFLQNHVRLFSAEPVSLKLPGPGLDGTIDLAVRFYMSPSTRFISPDAGGMHGPPSLGLASTLRLLQYAEKEGLLRSQFGNFMEAFLFLLVAPLALWAWFYNRQERAWLWFFLALVWDSLSILSAALGSVTTAMSQTATVLISVVMLPFWTMFWWNWFGLREKRWIPRAAWIVVTMETVTAFCAQSPLLGLRFVPMPALHWFNVAMVCCMAAITLLQIIILVEGFRLHRTEALLAALPILLGLFNALSGFLLVAFNIPNEFFPFGLGIYFANIVVILMVLIVCILALRRFVGTQVRESLVRQAVRKDLEQAQQLQQRVLIPEAIASKHFTIEAEYLPAQTVGGDFFQTLTKPDGTLLVVIGDVSGKGVSAAMLVAVLVGAIRSHAHFNSDPSSMLAMLNERLLGRSGGHFATCIVAEIRPDGTMRVANAGHLPPYQNGKELELEGSLPLGIAEEAEYSVQTFALQPGDRLTFMTDGVVEATNAAKELFGFERTREISRQHAAAIVEQAQGFGQQDDITVLGVAFVGAAG
ncbi:MAG: PP2C family protein-serine/threonine phosphatase [Silvibacterium sp.]